MELNDANIRDVLLRNIADRNKTLASIIGAIHGGRGKEYSNSFTSVLRAFLGNNRIAMNEMESIVDSFGGRYAPYHFFDNNTLWAYDCFLGVLLNEIWGKNLKPADLDRAFNTAGQYMFRHSGTASSNFYNADRPVTCVTKDTPKGRVYSPRRPLTEKEFVKKYGVTSSSCVNDVQKHFMWNNGKLATTKKSKEIKKPKTIEEEDVQCIQYRYNGKIYKLAIESTKNYLGEDGEPVKTIKASSKDGVLFTTRTLRDTIYNGILYDLDGRVARDEESGEIFYPSKTIEVKKYIDNKKRSKKETKDTLNSRYEYTDDDQMKLF